MKHIQKHEHPQGQAPAGSWRRVGRSLDEYTLWSFNPQPPLVASRRARQRHEGETH